MSQSAAVSGTGVSAGSHGPLMIAEAVRKIDEQGLWPEVEAKSASGNRIPRLSAPLTQICRSLDWPEHRRIAIEWFCIVTIVMWVTIPFDYQVVPHAIQAVLISHGGLTTIACLLALRAWRTFGSEIWQGLSTCLFVAIIMLAAILTGRQSDGADFERFVVVGFFGMATGVAFVPLSALWTAAAAIVLMSSFLIGQFVNPAVNMASGLLFTLYCSALCGAFVWYRWRTTGHQVRAALLRLIEARSARLLKESHDRLHLMAHRDAMTGLCNRMAIMDMFEQQLANAPIGSVLSVAMIDIDDFKRLNDSLGHQAGDEALRRVGALFLDFAKADGARCGRIGGEEFLILMPGVGADIARARIAALMGRLNRLHIDNPGSTVSDRVTLSAGIVTTILGQHDGCPSQELLRRADLALYEAKKGGRNRIISMTGAKDEAA